MRCHDPEPTAVPHYSSALLLLFPRGACMHAWMSRPPQVAEPKQDNSGIAQGIFVRRHRVPCDGDSGEYIAPTDMAVGATLTVYGRTFFLVRLGCAAAHPTRLLCTQRPDSPPPGVHMKRSRGHALPPATPCRARSTATRSRASTSVAAWAGSRRRSSRTPPTRWRRTAPSLGSAGRPVRGGRAGRRGWGRRRPCVGRVSPPQHLGRPPVPARLGSCAAGARVRCSDTRPCIPPRAAQSRRATTWPPLWRRAWASPATCWRETGCASSWPTAARCFASGEPHPWKGSGRRGRERRRAAQRGCANCCPPCVLAPRSAPPPRARTRRGSPSRCRQVCLGRPPGHVRRPPPVRAALLPGGRHGGDQRGLRARVEWCPDSGVDPLRCPQGAL